MIQIRDWLSPIVVGGSPDETVSVIVKRMHQHGIGSVIILDNERKPLGILTERDVLNKIVAMDKNPKTTLAKEVMTSPIETISIQTPVLEVFKLFSERNYRHLPVTLEDGRIVGVLSFRSKPFIQEVCRIMTSLQTVNEMKSHFLASVSHELRTPLVSITKSASIILNDMKQMREEEIINFLKIIERQGGHLQLLINDLLDVTSLEAGKLRVYKRNLDIAKLIEQSIRNCGVLAERKQLSIRFEKNTDQTTAYVDEYRILQVLNNLLENAIQFTPEGGYIWVSIASSDGKNLIIYVKDTGIGIPKDKLKIIFERFEKAHDPLTTSFAGVGLGLTIVKELVTLHEGMVWVESEENKGSSFYFTLPIHSEIVT